MEQIDEYPTICPICKCALTFASWGIDKLLVCQNCLKSFGEYYIYYKGADNIISRIL